MSPLSPSDLAREIARAWELRFNQREEACYRQFSRLAEALPLSRARERDTIELALSGPENEAYLACFCLQASFDRWQGKYTLAESLLAAVSEVLVDKRHPLPACLTLQLGLNAFGRGETPKAMELFLESAARAGSDFELLCAEINLLQCLTSLGLPHETALDRVRDLIERCGARHDVSSFQLSFEHLGMRESFQAGRLGQAFAETVNSIATHNDVFRLWVQQLPYHAHSRSRASLELLRFRSTLFHRSYRLRTLYGLSHPEEETEVKPSEWVDRVYLWVWRWLVDPADTPLSEVLSTLGQFRLADIEDRLTAEDRCLLSNAVGWLSLFDAATATLVKSFRAKLHRGRFVAPLLELEALIIQVWAARRDGNVERSEKYRRLLAADCLYHSTEIHLSRLLPDGPGSGPLSALRERLVEATARKPASVAPVFVNLASFEVTSHSQDKTVASEPLCTAIDLLKRKPRLRLEELAFVVFGITRYDPLVHNPRIYNLLARLKDITKPLLRVQVKGGLLFADGDWESISVFESTEDSLTIQRSAEWKAFLAPGGHRLESRVLTAPRDAKAPKLRANAVLSRRDFETLTGKSRATITRRLEEWRKLGWIVRKRQARATRYEVTLEFAEKFNEGEVWA